MKKEVLNKRIKIICLFVSLSILAFSLRNKNDNKTIATMSVPVTNKTIVVDAGHGGEDRRSSK